MGKMSAAKEKERQERRARAAKVQDRIVSKSLAKVTRQRHKTRIRAKYGPSGSPAPVVVKHVEPDPRPFDVTEALAREADPIRKAWRRRSKSV